MAGYVDVELNRRFPGREQRRVSDPKGLKAAFSALELAWRSVLERVETMPPGVVDVSVDGEWSFAETLRHLVLATDAWLGRAVLRREQPFHPLGLTGPWAEGEGFGTPALPTVRPSYPDVLAARADRVALVRDFLAQVTAQQLDEPRANPWDPSHQECTRSCLHVILEEEWEHLRFALRDLEAIDAATAGVPADVEAARGTEQDH